MKFGSIEAGGTKFVVATGDESLKLINSLTIPTTTPEETIAACLDFFKENKVDSLAIGSFGPIAINPASEKFGFITTTPKAHWAYTDLLGAFKTALDIPIAFTTDVNSAAYGEMISTGSQSLVYYTVGTGIGGGVVQEGKFIGGYSHAEMGHQFVKRHPLDLDFEGVCPFHKDCLEGLAAGPSVEARTGVRGELLEENHPVWDIQAFYIAQAAVNATLSMAPEKIVFGGGVMGQKHMIVRVHEWFTELLNGYVQLPVPVEEFIVRPSIGNNGSATLGNFALAKKLLK